MKKHYNMYKKEPDFENSFQETPIIGYWWSKTIGEYLTRAKLYLHKYRGIEKNGIE